MYNDVDYSTMSGRRLRDSVKKVLLENGFPNDVTVVIAGLSNTYSDYVTTFEEYQVCTFSYRSIENILLTQMYVHVHTLDSAL